MVGTAKVQTSWIVAPCMQDLNVGSMCVCAWVTLELTVRQPIVTTMNYEMACRVCVCSTCVRNCRYDVNLQQNNVSQDTGRVMQAM